jgi:hypothetical protein
MDAETRLILKRLHSRWQRWSEPVPAPVESLFSQLPGDVTSLYEHFGHGKPVTLTGWTLIRWSDD